MSGSQSNQSFIKLAAISAAVLIGVAAAQMQATKESRHSHLQESLSQTLDKADVSQESVSSPLVEAMGEEQLWCCRMSRWQTKRVRFSTK